MVKEIWVKPVNSVDPIDVLNIKLERVKEHLKGWGIISLEIIKKKRWS
jgi:hypothetical protein